MRLRHKTLSKCIETECQAYKVIRFLCVTRDYMESLRVKHIIASVCYGRSMYVYYALCTFICNKAVVIQKNEGKWVYEIG